MFIKYSTGQILPKKSKGKGSQGKKIVDDSQETIDVSKKYEPEPKPVKKKTADIALELGESISLTEAEEEESPKQVHATHARIVTESAKKKTGSRGSRSVVIQDTLSAPKPKLATSKPNLKGEKVITKEKVILEWGSEQESEYSNAYQLNNEEKDDKEGDADDEGDNHINDTQDTDNEEVETEFDEDEIYNKSASTKEPVEEPIAEVVMDDAGENVVRDDDQPQDTFKPKTTTTPNRECPIDFSKYVLNRLKIDNLTQDLLLGPAYDLLKGTCTSSIELEYNFQECFNALTDKLDWNNSEGDRYSFDMSKPLPLQGCPCHLTVATDYFFNNDMEYLKSFDLDITYTTSITKTEVARHEIIGDQALGGRHKLWYKSQKLHRYGHLEEVVVKRADRQLCKFKEGDFMDLHLNDIEDMLLLAVQHKLFHLNKSDIVDSIVALCMFTRGLIIKRQVEDLQLVVESYQKKLNVTPPQQTFPEIKFKELYTLLYKPPGDELHHRILDFCLGYNNEMSKRKQMAIDKKRSELMAEFIDKQMRERRIIRNLERLVAARKLEMDYKLMTRTV
nr:hypothetical protein [Tanacetum cinerariifolium]